jgi:hypothetical protein
MSDIDTDDSVIKINLNLKKEIIKEKLYSNDLDYKIINYDKNYLCFDDIEMFKYRSIILSQLDNKIVCFSPPKSILYTDFISNYPITDSIYVNEYIEGIMINLFYEERANRWEIATKSAIGGNYFYYRNHYGIKQKQKTFYQMFLEAFRLDEDGKLSDIFLLNELPKTYCYSFVLQHPDNHIVLEIPEPKVFLVAVYEIINNNTVKAIPIVEVETWKCFLEGIVEFPKQIKIASYDDLYSDVSSIQNNTESIGVMITDFESGIRTKIENPVYNQKKILRGNNPNLQYQFLCLKRINKIEEFLKFFPRYKGLFKKFATDYSNFILNVHASYLTYYVKKEKIIISKQYFPHIYKIHHEIYLPSLNTETPIIIRKHIVINYFDKLEPRELLYHLNYNIRMNENR